MGLLGMACAFAMRVNLSVAIVAMVKWDKNNHTNTSNLDQVCPLPKDQDDSDQSEKVCWYHLNSAYYLFLPFSFKDLK